MGPQTWIIAYVYNIYVNMNNTCKLSHTLTHYNKDNDIDIDSDNDVRRQTEYTILAAITSSYTLST